MQSLRSFFPLCFIGICTIVSPNALAGSQSCDSRVNNTQNKLLECVTVEGAREHQAALQSIADDNNGIRTSGTPGYDASVDYVAERMQAAGYDVTVQPFEYQAFIELSPSILEQVAPPPAGSIVDNIMSYSGSGDVTAAVSTLSVITGCNGSDFAGFTAGLYCLNQSWCLYFCSKSYKCFRCRRCGGDHLQ